MKPEDWKNEWGVDNLVLAPENCNQLPDIARRFLTSYGFPRRIIIENNLEVDFDLAFEILFEPLSKTLIRYNEGIRWGDFYDPEIDKALSQLIVIAEEEFCNGSASYCIHQCYETVTRIDIEGNNLDTFVNSSVPQFGESLLLAVRWSKANQQAKMENWKTSLNELAESIKAIDAKVFQYQDSFWEGLIRYATENEIRSLEITADPKRSRPRF